jgi:hypothetical protein
MPFIIEQPLLTTAEFAQVIAEKIVLALKSTLSCSLCLGGYEIKLSKEML